MDQDEFNDFQGPAPLSEPETSQPQPQIPPLTNYIETTVEPAVEPQPSASFEPSYSLDMNAPSQQTYEYDSIDWEGSAWPNMTKMESDHMAITEHLAPDFTKRNSQKELSWEPTHPPQLQMLNNESNEVKEDYSNSATLHSNVYEDFDFGQMSKPHNEPINHSPESLPEKQDVFSPTKEPNQRSETHEMGSMHEQNRNENKQQIEDEFNDYGTAEARKQSQDFEYQEAVQPEAETYPIQMHKQVVQTQNDYHSQPDHNQTEKKQQPVQQEFVEYQVSEPAQDFHNYEEKHQTTVQKQEQHPQQDEDDQFGDFEQTVQTNQQVHLNGISAPLQEQNTAEEAQQYQQSVNQSNEVKIDSGKAPYDMEVASRQQQLQKFVDSLPDYGFLLARAFNTL